MNAVNTASEPVKRKPGRPTKASVMAAHAAREAAKAQAPADTLPQPKFQKEEELADAGREALVRSLPDDCDVNVVMFSLWADVAMRLHRAGFTGEQLSNSLQYCIGVVDAENAADLAAVDAALKAGVVLVPVS
jgi:hypothetical protein